MHGHSHTHTHTHTHNCTSATQTFSMSLWNLNQEHSLPIKADWPNPGSAPGSEVDHHTWHLVLLHLLWLQHSYSYSVVFNLAIRSNWNQKPLTYWMTLASQAMSCNFGPQIKLSPAHTTDRNMSQTMSSLCWWHHHPHLMFTPDTWSIHRCNTSPVSLMTQCTVQHPIMCNAWPNICKRDATQTGHIFYDMTNNAKMFPTMQHLMQHISLTAHSHWCDVKWASCYTMFSYHTGYIMHHIVAPLSWHFTTGCVKCCISV